MKGYRFLSVFAGVWMMIWAGGCTTPSATTDGADPRAPAADAPADVELPDAGVYGEVVSEMGEEVLELMVAAGDDPNAWNSGVVWPLGDDFGSGEVLTVSFALRAEDGFGSDPLPVMVELAEAPYTKIHQTDAHPGNLFTPVAFETRVDPQTAALPLNLTLHLGGRTGRLLVRDVRVTRAESP